MNEVIQLLLAMIVPGCVLGMAAYNFKMAWRDLKARRQECRRPQGGRS
mgnify:CR=1 FL=1